MEIKNRILKTELVKWRNIKWFQNKELKKLAPGDMLKLKRSLINNNFIMPFHIWKDGKQLFFLDGHHREKAMRELEEKGFDGQSIKIPDMLPANFVKAKDRKEAAKLVLIYSSIYAKITEDGLTEYFKKNKLDISVINNEINIPDLNLDKISITDEKTDEQLDEVPEIPRKALSRSGDLFILNKKHHILCGDSMKGNDFKKLINKDKIDLLITSPPYNVGIKYESFKDKLKEDQYRDFIQATLKNSIGFISENRFIVWNVGVSPKTMHHKQVGWLIDIGLSFTRQIIWQKVGVPYPLFTVTKKKPLARNYHPNYTHEMIYIFSNSNGKTETGKNISILDQGQNDVWTIQQSMATSDLEKRGEKAKGMKSGTKYHKIASHPAAYPVKIPLTAINYLTNETEKVLDIFLGSGSTLIACEQIKRNCYGMEIDPIYIDVTLKRYHNLFPDNEIKCINRKFNFEKLWNN